MRLALTDGWIDVEQGEIVRSGRRMPLPPLERRLLAHMARQPGRAVPVHELHAEVWGKDTRIETRPVYYAVRRLRQRLEPVPGEPTVLVGTETRGFLLRPTPPAQGSSPFVGRGAELRRVLDLLEVPGALVVVTGPSGMGKSRLLGEVARALVHVVTVDAEGAVDPRGLREAIGRDLGIRLGAEHAVGPMLAARVGDRTLILDHADQLEADGLAALDRWRQAAPGMRILAARPAPVAVNGAQHVALGPLPLDDARTLFHLRATAAGGRPGPPSSELDALLGQLDGHPLAIVLAAWRAARLPVALIHRELEATLSSLAVPLYDHPARHHTLEAAIAFSVAGLSTAERAGIRYLSGIDAALPEAAAVALLADVGGHPTLDALVERGLVRPRRRLGDGVYEVLVGVRRFLADPEVRSVAARRFAAWWVAEPRTQEAERHAGPCLVEVGATLARLGDTDLAPRIVAAALRFGLVEGGTAVHEALAEQVLALPIEPVARARIGWLAVRVRGGPYRVEVLRPALIRLEETGEPGEVVEATLHYAYLFAERGDLLAEVRSRLERVRPLAESSDRVARLAFVEAHIAKIAGAHRAAATHLERAIAHATDPRHRVLAQNDLSLVRSNLGDTDGALAMAMEARLGAGPEPDPHAHAGNAWSVAWALWTAGRFDEARALLASARARIQPVNPYHATRLAVMEGFAALAQGRPDDARALLLLQATRLDESDDHTAHVRVGLALARLRLGEPALFAGIDPDAPFVQAMASEDEIEFRAYCAEIAARSGDPVDALRHLEAAEARMGCTDLAETSVPGRALAAARGLVRRP